MDNFKVFNIDPNSLRPNDFYKDCVIDNPIGKINLIKLFFPILVTISWGLSLLTQFKIKLLSLIFKLFICSISSFKSTLSSIEQ